MRMHSFHIISASSPAPPFANYKSLLHGRFNHHSILACPAIVISVTVCSVRFQASAPSVPVFIMMSLYGLFFLAGVSVFVFSGVQGSTFTYKTRTSLVELPSFGQGKPAVSIHQPAPKPVANKVFVPEYEPTVPVQEQEISFQVAGPSAVLQQPFAGAQANIANVGPGPGLQQPFGGAQASVANFGPAPLPQQPFGGAQASVGNFGPAPGLQQPFAGGAQANVGNLGPALGLQQSFPGGQAGFNDFGPAQGLQQPFPGGQASLAGFGPAQDLQQPFAGGQASLAEFGPAQGLQQPFVGAQAAVADFGPGPVGASGQGFGLGANAVSQAPLNQVGSSKGSAAGLAAVAAAPQFPPVQPQLPQLPQQLPGVQPQLPFPQAAAGIQQPFPSADRFPVGAPSPLTVRQSIEFPVHLQQQKGAFGSNQQQEFVQYIKFGETQHASPISTLSIAPTSFSVPAPLPGPQQGPILAPGPVPSPQVQPAFVPQPVASVSKPAPAVSAVSAKPAGNKY